MDALIQWFANQGGSFDTSALTFAPIDGYGRGALALRDLPEGYTLFSLPRELTLSTRTSSLLGRLGTSAWKEHGLHVGWAGLILCMMWEAALGADSKWSAYLGLLPSSFDTPMFWTEEELMELKATAVVDKLGKDQAEKDYREKIVPVLQSRPDLFPEDRAHHFSLESYHLMGSRILSRSFQVEKWDSGSDGEEDAPKASESMDVDMSPADETASPSDEAHGETLIGNDDGGDDSDDEADPADVAMVPMADMLNARYESENAKLFYEERDLRMATTKPLRAGEQILNTYADLPNSYLLRQYGHVDLVPMPGGRFGNPADVVEVRADLAVVTVSELHPSQTEVAERVDWWLEEGGEDVFMLETSHDLPEELIAFVRLLLMPTPEWQKVRQKSKLPKPKVDGYILKVAVDMLRKRLAEYPTTLEEDEGLLSEENVGSLSTNKKHAVVVRLGEKRILHGAVAKAEERLTEASGQTKKRKADGAPEVRNSKKGARR
ncbi:SET domain-containing protein [Amylostereum chailletii]|nr:SET domain-containing protein [Amylostereum chailletii]